MKRSRAIALGYMIVGLATFGYAAQSYKRDAWARYSVCASVASNNAIDNPDCRTPWVIDAPVVGLVSAALWPLYVSWTLVDAASTLPPPGEPQ